jgi:hypothetical protein
MHQCFDLLRDIICRASFSKLFGTCAVLMFGAADVLKVHAPQVICVCCLVGVDAGEAMQCLRRYMRRVAEMFMQMCVKDCRKTLHLMLYRGF